MSVQKSSFVFLFSSVEALKNWGALWLGPRLWRRWDLADPWTPSREGAQCNSCFCWRMGRGLFIHVWNALSWECHFMNLNPNYIENGPERRFSTWSVKSLCDRTESQFSCEQSGENRGERRGLKRTRGGDQGFLSEARCHIFFTEFMNFSKSSMRVEINFFQTSSNVHI